MPIFGINISSADGEVDFSALKRAGVRFALIRASCGLREDHRSAENVARLAKEGIVAAAFHELRLEEGVSAAYSGVSQAEVFVDMVKSSGRMLNIYGCIAKIDESANELRVGKLIGAFCRRVTHELGGEMFVGLNGEIGGRIFESFEDDIRGRLWRWEIGNDICSGREVARGEILRRINEHGALEGCKGVYGQNFAYGRMVELIFSAKCAGETDVILEFLAYLRKSAAREKLLEKLTELVCKGCPRPERFALMSYEKRLTLIRWQCGLTDDEMRALIGFQRAEEVVRGVCGG